MHKKHGESKERKMNVLSLFDGLSGGQIALRRAGIEYDNYFASEIDKYAIPITQKNYLDTIQLGDIKKIKGVDLPKIDLAIGGSPCQGFSFAGKQLNFNDERSKLFFEFVRLLKEVTPKHFLFENVKMKKEWQDIISNFLEVEPIELNSSSVSAQNRKRLYWTNIQGIKPPEDKRIYLKDILQPENEVEDKYYIKKPKAFEGMDINGKGKTLRVGGGRSQTKKHNFDIIKLDKRLKPKADQNKAACLTGGGHSGGNHSDMDIICIGCDYRKDEGIRIRKNGKNGTLMARARNDESCGQLTIIQKAHGFNKGGVFKDKSPTLLSNSWEHNNHIDNGYKLRRLTPIECERLQTVPDGWTKYGINEKKEEIEISNTQRYKMLGNGFTVDVIVHILKHLK